MPIVVISEQRRRDEIKRAELREALDRERTREYLKILAWIVFWNLVGLVLMGLAMAAPSQDRGDLLMVAGMAVGYGGMIVSLFLQILRMMERGDL